MVIFPTLGNLDAALNGIGVVSLAFVSPGVAVGLFCSDAVEGVGADDAGGVGVGLSVGQL